MEKEGNVYYYEKKPLDQLSHTIYNLPVCNNFIGWCERNNFLKGNWFLVELNVVVWGKLSVMLISTLD